MTHAEYDLMMLENELDKQARAEECAEREIDDLDLDVVFEIMGNDVFKHASFLTKNEAGKVKDLIDDFYYDLRDKLVEFKTKELLGA